MVACTSWGRLQKDKDTGALLFKDLGGSPNVKRLAKVSCTCCSVSPAGQGGDVWCFWPSTTLVTLGFTYYNCAYNEKGCDGADLDGENNYTDIHVSNVPYVGPCATWTTPSAGTHKNGHGTNLSCPDVPGNCTNIVTIDVLTGLRWRVKFESGGGCHTIPPPGFQWNIFSDPLDDTDMHACGGNAADTKCVDFEFPDASKFTSIDSELTVIDNQCCYDDVNTQCCFNDDQDEDCANGGPDWDGVCKSAAP